VHGRRLRALLFVAVLAGVTALPAAAIPAGGAILPPDHPYVNEYPSASVAACGSASAPTPSCPAGLWEIDADRAAEGVVPMTLPTNYASLTPQEQIFTIANLERVDRGLPAAGGLASQLDAYAQRGVNGATDPTLPPYGISYGNWASTPNILLAYTLWMYDDGWGTSNVTNIACTGPSSGGCWLHRQIILGSYSVPFLMGAGWGIGTAEIFTGADTVDPPYFSWSQVQSNLPVGTPQQIGVSSGPGQVGGGGFSLWASGEPMNVTMSISGGGGVFSLGSSTCSMPVGGTCNVPLRFAPPAIGSYNATLVVNGPNGTQSVPIHGASSHGYRLAASDGGLFAYGDAGFYGSTGALHLNSPMVGAASTPDGGGYWMVGADGGVFTFGDARFFGSTGALHLNRPIVGMAATPDGGGYWLVASDGGVFAFGDAHYHGSAASIRLNRPIVGIASSPDAGGYWLVASDGGVFTYGDAAFHGSAGNLSLNRPIVGVAATHDGGGYWLVASDGGVFSYGDAGFSGSTGNLVLNTPIVGLSPTHDGGGYWLVASDGGVFNFGDAAFFGSMGGTVLNAPIVSVAGGIP
jgi:hypothetical protein